MFKCRLIHSFIFLPSYSHRFSSFTTKHGFRDSYQVKGGRVGQEEGETPDSKPRTLVSSFQYISLSPPK